MLAFDTVGRGEGPFVVLLHGWPLDRSIWREVAPRVAEAGFRVLVPDLPGFGSRPPLPPASSTVEAFADEVAAFLEAHARGPTAVAGHSFGGYVALALAERDPDRVAGLGLIASRTFADSEAARRGRHEAIEKVRAQGTAALLPGLAEKLLAPTAPSGLRERAAATVARAHPGAVVAGLAAMARRPDRTRVLEGFEGPVLVVHGAQDALIPISEAPAPSGPHRTVRVLPGAGHMPMWESIGPTADAIVAWASGLRSARRTSKGAAR